MRPHITQRQDSDADIQVHSQLSWSGAQPGLLLQGSSDMTVLRSIKNILQLLMSEFNLNEKSRMVLQPQAKDNFNKRLQLIQSEVDGLLRKKITYSDDRATGYRTLDYSSLLNQKQNQILQLEKKINNLEQRLRRLSAREVQLQNHIAHIYHQLQLKDNIISAKNNIILSQVATSNKIIQSWAKLKRNIENNKTKLGQLQKLLYEGVQSLQFQNLNVNPNKLVDNGAKGRLKLPELSNQSQQLKINVIQMFRQFQRLFKKQNVTRQQIQLIILGFLTQIKDSQLYQQTLKTKRRIKAEQDLKKLKQNFNMASNILKLVFKELKQQIPGLKLKMQKDLFQILSNQNIQINISQKGEIFIHDLSNKTVQIPVQDLKTKKLLHLLATQLKKIYNKYPKLWSQINQNLAQFFQQQIIDLIQVDQIERLVQIVKYKPQIVRVEDIYTYDNSKSRKIQFHLRVLLKALLQQLEKIKKKTDVVFEMDQGVLRMIRQQIMEAVNIDDILKVFKVVPKIVEVEKIVEKVVQKIVQVPQIVTVDRIVEKIIEVQKIKQVDRIINVPLQHPVFQSITTQKIVPIQNTIEKVIEVPTVREKLVQVKVQVPTVVQVEKIQDRVVQVQKIVQVERIVNHIQKQYQTIQVIHQKIVPVQKIIEKIVEIPIIIEKIVQKIVQVPKVVEIQKIVQKIIPVIQYRNARQVLNHIQIQHEIVERIIQKPVPIIEIVQKIREVPQVIQKIVQLKVTQTKIQQCQVIRQKIVIQQKIKEIQKIVIQPLEIVRQIPRQIQRVIQVPIVHERLTIVKQYIQKPIIERFQNTIIKQVYIRDPIIVKQPKIIEVQKIINHFIEVPKPFKYIEQKIVEVPRIIDRVKQIRVQVDKIVEKMIQIPKVVQVQKVVQKIIVVPRVIQKVIQIPQIVEKTVEKQVIKQIIRQVQKKIQIPVIQDRPIEIEVQKNVFVQVQKVVQKIIDKLVQVPRLQQIVEIKQIVQEKVVEIIKQIPKILQVQKIVTLYAQELKVIQIDKPIIIPIQVPTPVQRIVQKLVIVQQMTQKLIQVPQIVQKVVTIKKQEAVIHQIQKIVQKVVIDQKIKQVEKVIPFVQQVIKEIPTLIQKIVPIQSTVQSIVATQQIVEKIVQKTISLPKIYEVQRVKQVLIQVPKFIQVQKIFPQIIKVNNYVQKVVQRIVQVPKIIQQLKQVKIQVQKVVQVQKNNKQIVQVQKLVQKVVILQKLKQVVKNINHIEKVIQIVQRLEQIPPVQITTKQEIIIQVPYILQKIVQKIVVMPQIVQVLKYVHQITEKQEIGVAVQVQSSSYEQKYRLLSKNIKNQLDFILKQLRALKNSQLQPKINSIQAFLLQFQKFILNPRIIKVPHKQVVQKIVQVQKLVQIPTKEEKSVRMQLAMSLLIQKLILQLKRIRNINNINLQLDEDVKLIFFTQLNLSSKLQGQFSKEIEQYSSLVNRKFENLGCWSRQHQLMLNSFLQQRFLMAQLVNKANLQIQKALETSQKRLEGMRKYKKDKNTYQTYLKRIQIIITNENIDFDSKITEIKSILNQFRSFNQQIYQQPIKIMGERQINDDRLKSYIRQKDQEICRLKDLLKSKQYRLNEQTQLQIRRMSQQLNYLRLQNNQLRITNKQAQARFVQLGLESQSTPYKQQIKQLQQKNLNIQSQISRHKSDVINLLSQNKILKQMINDRTLYMKENNSILESSHTAQFAIGIEPSRYGHLAQRNQMTQNRPNQAHQSLCSRDFNKGNMLQTRVPQVQDKVKASKLYQLLLTQSKADQTLHVSPDLKFSHTPLTSEFGRSSQLYGHIEGSRFMSSGVKQEKGQPLTKSPKILGQSSGKSKEKKHRIQQSPNSGTVGKFYIQSSPSTKKQDHGSSKKE